MMGLFASLRAEISGVVDEVFSEPLRLLPLVDGRKDPSRAPVEFSAPLLLGERSRSVSRFGARNDERGALQAGGGEIRLDRAAWADLDLREGDRICALARPGAPMFDVLDVDRRRPGRLLITLGDC